MEYVIGIDIGTSSVKAILAGKDGHVYGEASSSYPLINPQQGYIEQNPDHWVMQTKESIKQLISASQINPDKIESISFSGQMHSLVVLDHNHNVLHNAILWNDTRTSKQCKFINEKLGERLWEITKNDALEGFTLPKILWLKDNQPDIFEKVFIFLMPKDYVRFQLTGELATDYSDAAGTLLLDIEKKEWSSEILATFKLPESICPPLLESTDFSGHLLPEVAKECGLNSMINTYTGGADNACGALGVGALNTGDTLCSIGTSGVILSAETNLKPEKGLHFFYHSKPNTLYKMGVTLAAGHSLSWFKNSFAPKATYEELLENISSIPAGSGGLLFTPYISGERTPNADSTIRGSFIGIDSKHKISNFSRAVLEGVTFSLRECLELMNSSGRVSRVISIGGGSKNRDWMQMQADIFQTEIIKLENDHGPALGAAIIAAMGTQWFNTFEACCKQFIREEDTFEPIDSNVRVYEQLFKVYQDIYHATKDLNSRLKKYRNFG